MFKFTKHSYRNNNVHGTEITYKINPVKCYVILTYIFLVSAIQRVQIERRINWSRLHEVQLIWFRDKK